MVLTYWDTAIHCKLSKNRLLLACVGTIWFISITVCQCLIISYHICFRTLIILLAHRHSIPDQINIIFYLPFHWNFLSRCPETRVELACSSCAKPPATKPERECVWSVETCPLTRREMSRRGVKHREKAVTIATEWKRMHDRQMHKLWSAGSTENYYQVSWSHPYYFSDWLWPDFVFLTLTIWSTISGLDQWAVSS